MSVLQSCLPATKNLRPISHFEPNPLVLKLRQSGALTEDDDEVLADLCKAPRMVEAGTVLVRQGERTEGVHLVLKGFAYRYKILATGRRQIVGVLLPGDFSDIQGAVLPRSDHSIAALTDSSIVRLPHRIMDDLSLGCTRIARALWWATRIDQCIMRSWLTNMGQQPAEKSLAHLCCEHLLRLQIVGRAGPNACEMPFFQEHLAEILGISDVHVNRTLRDLRDNNLMEIKRRRLIVPDVAKLRAFCNFDPSYLQLMAIDEA